MAYGVKYRFQLESYNKTVYRVDLLEDGYSGTITTRPLGKAPVLRMQEADPFRSTSCDLVLECQSDGEYIDLYTTDPFHFKVEVYRIDDNDGAWIIWRGFVPTEIYSEPDIAPPYDVRITATDGIGLLKEYTFEAVGAKSIRAHICDLLEKTGDSAPMYYYATKLSVYQSTEVAFMDDALIDLDYLAGENCYDVLKAILVSLRSVLIYRGSHWLIVREVDVQMSSDGMLTAVQCITSNPYYVPSSTTVKMGKSVGQMGVADMWPVGYLTRRVSPAKKAVHVRAPWHYVNGYPEVSANGWTLVDNASFDSTNKLYHIGTRSQSVATGKGSVRSSKTLFRFMDNFKVVIKANAHSVYGNDVEIGHYVRVDVSWAPLSGSGTSYWSSTYGWNDDSRSEGEAVSVEETNESHDPNACKVVEVLFPPVPDNNTGLLTIKVNGALVDIYDIEVLPATVAGYEDHILIDNGARGEAESIDVFGGRLMSSNFINLDFYQGVFFHTNGQASGPDTQFSDLMNIGKDFMSLTALAYAREVAAPRIEISGKLNHEYDTALGMPAPFIKSHGVWALMKNYDWDMMTEDVSFTAVTLPSVLLDVEDEIINSIAPEGGISGGSSSGSGGGGGGGGSYTLPIASANTLGGVKVGTGLSIDSSTGVLTANGGGYTLPIASANTLGGIKVGSGLSINALTGVLSALANAFNGGEITQDLWLHTRGEDYGSTLFFGDKDGTTGYAYIKEDSDDHLTIYGRMGVTIAAGEGGSVVIQGLSIALGDISGVSISSPSNGQALVYRNGTWHNETIQGGGTYILPEATAAELGGIKVGFVESGKNYPVELDDNGNAYVNVPWQSGTGGSTVEWGTPGSDYVPLTVDGTTKNLLTDHQSLDDYVTKGTTQTITGAKTFSTNPVTIGSSSGIGVDGSSYIDIGDARLKWDASTHSLHVTKRPGSSYSGNINVYADGDVGAGGPGSGSSVKYVNCANQSAYDSISPKDPATIYTIGTASSPSKIYLGSVQIH